MKNEQQILEQLVAHFGVERIVAELPQHEVCKALKLVTPQELAESLELSYDEMRWRMNSKQIPEPSHKLVRRCYFTLEEAKQIRSHFKKK